MVVVVGDVLLIEQLAAGRDVISEFAALARLAIAAVLADLRTDLANAAIAKLSPWAGPVRGQRENAGSAPGPDGRMLGAWAWRNARVRLHLDVEVRA